MRYVNCRTSLTLGGRVFAYGETIPTSGLKQTSIAALVAARRIALVDDAGEVVAPVAIPRAVALPKPSKSEIRAQYARKA